MYVSCAIYKFSIENYFNKTMRMFRIKLIHKIIFIESITSYPSQVYILLMVIILWILLKNCNKYIDDE